MERIFKPLADFEKVKWVLLAKGKEKVGRYCFHLVNVKDGWIETADRHRLHKGKLEMEIPEGTYEVISNGKKEIVLEIADKLMEYPDTKQVFPKGEAKKIIKIEENMISPSIPYSKLVKEMAKERTLDFKYFLDVTKGSGCFTVEIFGADYAVKFSNDERIGLIMPLKH